MWWKKKPVERTYAWEGDLDLDPEGEEEDEDDGPTLVTVDDGKGGIKHIKIDRPADTQSEMGHLSTDGTVSVDGSLGYRITSPTLSKKTSMAKPGLGELVKKELKGKHFLHIEPHSEKLRKRIVSKRGNINVGKTKVSKRKRKYLNDIFNTMLDLQWRYVHIVFLLSFFLSWLAFAGVWYLILYIHGDFEPGHLPDQQEKSGWIPCVLQIKNFASVFLFSIETQHTIGYGSRQTSEECPEAIFVMSIQSIAGVMIQACMVGIIFSKLSRPKKRSQTLMFSKNAVVCQRDGSNCLLFRVGNMRHSTLVEAHVRAILISKRVTEEGEVMPYYQTEIKVGTDLDGEEDQLFFIWPTTLVHKIDSESPFFNMNARDFLKKRYEIVVILEGVIEQTGNSIQARSSYLPNEVLWGYRFVNLLNFKPSASEYKVDFSAFNAVYKVNLDTRSQKEKEEEDEEEGEEKDSDEEETENGGLKQKNHIPFQHQSVSSVSGYHQPPTFLPNNYHRAKSNSCVEIMHMV